jgi:predicted trehalose synthase
MVAVRALDDKLRADGARRRLCLLQQAEQTSPAALLTITARQARLVTGQRPALGQGLLLRHPEAGAIGAVVIAHHGDGISLALAGDGAAIDFALCAIAADISRPA